MHPISGLRPTRRDDDGLIPAFTNTQAHPTLEVDQGGIEVVRSQASEGLVPIPRQYEEKISLWTRPQQQQSQDEHVSRSRSRRKRTILMSGVLAAIVIVIAAVVGGVLGTRTRASQPSNTDEHSAPSTQSPNSSVPNQQVLSSTRGRSKSGLWNGTGLAFVTSNHPWDTQKSHYGSVFYQDWTGSLFFQPVDSKDNQFSTASNVPPQQVVVEDPPGSGRISRPLAANGTGLGATWYDSEDENTSHYFLVYVAQNGTLTDIWTNGSANWGPWHYGNLSSMGWKAPIDNRPTMFLDQNWQFYGKRYGEGGFRLTAGGVDGKLHVYSWDQVTGQWADSDVVLQDSYAYTGVQRVTLGNKNYQDTNSTVYTMDKDGQIVYYVQALTNATAWPSGGSYKKVVSGVYAAVNSSLVVVPPSFGDANVYFPSNSSGSMKALSLTGAPDSENGQFDGSELPVGPISGLRIMPGSCFTSWIPMLGIWYQDTGNSLAMARVPSISKATNATFLPSSK